MNQPQVELIPLKGAIRSDVPSTNAVLIRITPPQAETVSQRPALNLGLVIDRSGSMANERIEYARQAAIYAVQELTMTDRVSVTIFDDQVQTIVPNTLATDKRFIRKQIEAVQVGGSTALHAGWQEGANQVRANRISPGLNRVILLSDGHANVGVTKPDDIATDVNRMVPEGVTTSTLGVGLGYNEDLMEAMANSGDGNYYFIESASQLSAVFQRELQGLLATQGTLVSLGVETENGVTVAEVYNDFEKLPTGRYKLPNMVSAEPLDIVVSFNIPAMSQDAVLCTFRLAWSKPGEATRHTKRISFRLPVVSGSVWESLAKSVEVEEGTALLYSARMKRLAAEEVARGNRRQARDMLSGVCNSMRASAPKPENLQEVANLEALMQDLDDNADEKFKKASKFQSHSRQRGKPTPE